MPQWFAVVFVCALAFANPYAVAEAQTPEQQIELSRVERVGHDIYEHDRAAWLGTDALREELGDEVGLRLRGWITERDGDAVIVTFVSGPDSGPRALYRATLRGDVLTASGVAEAPLTDAQTRLFHARQTAMASPFAPCSPNYNTVVIPAVGGEFADVYLLPGTTDANVVPVGGAYRVRVNLATTEIIETQAFSRSCLVLPFERAAVGMFMTHLATPLPTETHVFINLSFGKALFIGIGAEVWSIENGRIRLVRP
jgi:hypothetical protein